MAVAREGAEEVRQRLAQLVDREIREGGLERTEGARRVVGLARSRAAIVGDGVLDEVEGSPGARLVPEEVFTRARENEAQRFRSAVRAIDRPALVDGSFWWNEAAGL